RGCTLDVRVERDAAAHGVARMVARVVARREGHFHNAAVSQHALARTPQACCSCRVRSKWARAAILFLAGAAAGCEQHAGGAVEPKIAAPTVADRPAIAGAPRAAPARLGCRLEFP